LYSLEINTLTSAVARVLFENTGFVVCKLALENLLKRGEYGVLWLEHMIKTLPAEKLLHFHTATTNQTLVELSCAWPQTPMYTGLIVHLVNKIGACVPIDVYEQLAFQLADRGQHVSIQALIERHMDCSHQDDTCEGCSRIGKQYMAQKELGDLLEFWRQCKPGLNIVRRACSTTLEVGMFTVVQEQIASTFELTGNIERVFEKAEAKSNEKMCKLTTGLETAIADLVEARKTNEQTRRKLVTVRQEENHTRVKAKAAALLTANEHTTALESLGTQNQMLQDELAALKMTHASTNKKATQKETKLSDLVDKLERRVAATHDQKKDDDTKYDALYARATCLEEKLCTALEVRTANEQALVRAKQTATRSKLEADKLVKSKTQACKALERANRGLLAAQANIDEPPEYGLVCVDDSPSARLHVVAPKKGKQIKWRAF
jgi:hypothetical protein